MILKKIKLNFLDNYYLFYDWLDSDNIKEYYNITLYKVSSKVISDLINYKIKIFNETILKDNNIAIFTDSFSFIAIMFNNYNSIAKSSLLLKDEQKIYDTIDNIKEIKLDYQKLEKDKKETDLRINNMIRNTINVEINNIIKNNQIEKLEYLYYEWFNKKENNINIMLSNINKQIKLPITNNEIYIYDLIKKTYKLV